VFSRGERVGESETIGYSARSKVWSAATGSLDTFVAWCDRLGSSLADPTPFTVDERLESLPAGCQAIAPMPPIVAARWPGRIFERSLRLVWPGGDQPLRDVDVDPEIRTDDSDTQRVSLRSNGEVLVSFVYDPGGQPFIYSVEGDNADSFCVLDHSGVDKVPLLDFLRNDPPQFFTADFASYCGVEYFECPSEMGLFDVNGILTYDWDQANVDIRCETQNSNPAPGMTYILNVYPQALANEFQHVFIDDGSGEVADIVACNIEPDAMIIRFVHCKASGGAIPGHRVDDVYVVSGQVIKSVRLIGSNRKLRDHLQRRSNLVTVAGNLNQVLLALVDGSKVKRYEIQLVQPGISAGQVTGGMLRPLAAARDYVLGAGCDSFTVVGSV